MTPATLREAAALIESLESERDALAEQVRVMREALEAAALQVPEVLDYIGPRGHSDVQQQNNPTSTLISSALALPPTEAEQRAKENAEKAALIESLESDRDALAETARVMREALEWSKVHVEYVADLDTHRHQVSWEASVALRLLEVALALAPTAAEQRAKANAEKAAKWDEARQIALALDEKLSEALKTKVGFADKDFEIAVTLLGALIEAAFGQKVPENGLVCSAVLTDGSEIFVEARRRTGEPYVKQAEAWRARIAKLESSGKTQFCLSCEQHARKVAELEAQLKTAMSLLIDWQATANGSTHERATLAAKVSDWLMKQCADGTWRQLQQDETLENQTAGETAERETLMYLMQFFAYEHLPAHLQAVSKPFGELAKQIQETLPENPEKPTALRKLLQAKDCAVRAVLFKA